MAVCDIKLQRISSVYHNKGPASLIWRTRREKSIRYFNQKWTLLKTLQISRAVLFRYVKQCPVIFALKFASFSRFCICNKPLSFSNLCAFFAYMCVISQEWRAPQQKKLQSNVSQVKWSPHAKIQLFLSTFKNGRKIQGTFLPAAFHLSLDISCSSKLAVFPKLHSQKTVLWTDYVHRHKYPRMLLYQMFIYMLLSNATEI